MFWFCEEKTLYSSIMLMLRKTGYFVFHPLEPFFSSLAVLILTLPHWRDLGEIEFLEQINLRYRANVGACNRTARREVLYSLKVEL